MEQKIIVKSLTVKGMTCPNCELRIENKLKKLPGVIYVEAKYANEIVRLTFDSAHISYLEIIDAIESLDYTVKSAPSQESSKGNNVSANQKNITNLLGIGTIIFAIYFLIKSTIGFNFIPEVNQNMGYGILFVVGILTSLHCVAMCGGINLSQCVAYKSNQGNKLSKLKPSILYNAGRVISYTLIGGIVGGIGSVVSLSGMARGFVAIIAGVFMIIMGLNMLNIFPALRKLTPRMPKVFGDKIHNNQGEKGPFYIGLLNGLMPCGPLQTMQIYALGTGSVFAGALSMFMFSLGTVPLMFGFGAVSSMLSSRFTHKMMKVSAVFVMVLGIVMLNNGLSLSGINTFAFTAPATSETVSNANTATVSSDVQSITTKLTSGRYSPITVQKGIPVKWTIQAGAGDLNGCNNAMIIPSYNIQLKLQPGDNIVEFTPNEVGTIPYSCWMGMIRSTITVVDNIDETSSAGKNSDPRNAALQDESAEQAEARSISENENLLFSENTGSGGSCCAGSALTGAFANGSIPTNDIQIATVVDGIQEATVTVSSFGYSPAVIVIEKGKEFVIKFVPETLNGCNSVIYFPEYQGGIDLTQDTETPVLTAESDFSFECGMSMLHGYVKVVEDINNIDIEAIKSDVENFSPASGSGGCCG